MVCVPGPIEISCDQEKFDRARSRCCAALSSVDDASVRDFDPEVARRILDDPDRPKVIFASQVVRQFASDLASAVVPEQPGLVLHRGAVAVRGLER